MRRSTKRFALILAVTLTGLTAPLWALPGDQQKPIHIEADQALRDEGRGFTRYEGNVTLDQGSLHIEADQLTVYHTAEDASRITARGRPATLRQQPEADKAEINAHANSIEYFRDVARVELRDSARIEQDGAIVTGDKIDYFINEQLVKADSDRSDQSSRVQVVIPAQALEEDTPPAPADPNDATATPGEDPKTPPTPEQQPDVEKSSGATGSP